MTFAHVYNTVKTSRKGANLSWISAICNHFGDMAARSRKSLKISATNLRYLRKNDSIRWNLQNFVPRGFIATPIDVLRVNFVKLGRPEIGKVVRYLPHKKFASLSRSCLCADRAQNLPGPATDNVLRAPQISCKSVHFRRSYSWTREHRQRHRKVFPIFGWSLASSGIMKITHTWRLFRLGVANRTVFAPSHTVCTLRRVLRLWHHTVQCTLSPLIAGI